MTDWNEQEEILDGMARAFWVQWYANATERLFLAEGPPWLPPTMPDGDEWPTASGGEDWMDVAPATPLSAIKAAAKLWGAVVHDNAVPALSAVLARPEVDSALELFGHYLAMEALGHGVGWSDSHDDHGLKLPYADFWPDEY